MTALEFYNQYVSRKGNKGINILEVMREFAKLKQDEYLKQFLQVNEVKLRGATLIVPESKVL